MFIFQTFVNIKCDNFVDRKFDTCISKYIPKELLIKLYIFIQFIMNSCVYSMICHVQEVDSLVSKLVS